jgi:predicted nucleic acid-binding protein
VKGLDTSVLIYAADTASPHHKRAVELLEQAAAGKWPACICEPSLRELSVALTSERFVKKPLAPAQAAKMIDRLIRYPQPVILYADDAVLRKTFKLMAKYPVQRARFAETLIAATLLAHGVKTIITASSASFSAIRELDVENPFEALFA